MRWRANLLLILSVASLLTLRVWAQGVRAVVVNETINVRVIPAIGAEVVGSVGAGYVFEVITARSADNQWLRVDFVGQEGWINLAPVSILDGNIAALPVADPRTIPYGGFESSRSGSTTKTGSVSARATAGVRVRAGPSTAYPTLANINYNQLMSLTGRTNSNQWFQVSFEGTLGWVYSQYVEILGGDIFTLPVDGIVADKPPISGDGTEEYIAQLKLIRDRLVLARISLNAIRASWADSALTGRASCQEYPAQPSDMTISIPLLAAFYNTLDPLQKDFNTAMFNLRKAINLFIEVCNQPGTGNPVGTATVQGALDVVNLTETQFVDLERRIAQLLPNEGVGAAQCLLVYRGKTEVLPVITYSTIYLDQFSRRNYSTGYCFDGIERQTINFQALPLPDSDLQLFIAIAPLDDPTNFVGIVQGNAGSLISLGPITLPRSTRYVIIIADIQPRETGPQGDFAFRVADITGLTATSVLTYDETTKSVVLTASGSTATTGTSGTGTTTTPTTVCPSTALTCSQLFSCEEARACLSSGNFSLDPDGDGIPCEDTVCGGQF